MSAFSGDTKILSWEEVNERIKELLSMGEYAPQYMLDNAENIEIKEVSKYIWYLHQDLSEGEKLFDNDGEIFAHGGFPAETEKIAQLLSDSDNVNDMVNGLTAFADRYEQNPSILRFKYHNPQKTLEAVKGLLHNENQYTAKPDFLLNDKNFITEDMIDNIIHSGSNVSEGKYRIYSYFLNNTDKQERIKFLKEEYGVGGSGSDAFNEWHDSKGVTLSIGSIITPRDEVTISWSTVEKKINSFIQNGTYMSDAELNNIPAYEKKVLAGKIYLFYDKVPQEYARPFPRDEHYYDAVNVIIKQLDDKEQAEKIFDQMTEVLDSVADKKTYDRKLRIVQ